MINVAMLGPLGDRGMALERLKKFIITVFELVPDNPALIPPVTRADVDWLRSDEGCLVVRCMVKAPRISIKNLITLIHGPLSPPKKSEIPHTREHMSHLAMAGIFKWERGKGQEKLYSLGADATLLRAACCRYFEQKLATLDVQENEIRRRIELCREIIQDLRGG